MRISSYSVAVVALVCACMPFAVNASEHQCETNIGKVVSSQGKVSVQRANSDTWEKLSGKGEVCDGDTIRTGNRSRAAVSMVNDTVMRINQKSTAKMENFAPRKEAKSILRLLSGIIHFFSRKPRDYQVSTTTATIGIRGTEFVVSANESETDLTVFEGVVQAQNDTSPLTLGGGESVSIVAGKTLRSETRISPRDQVQWGLYYPPILSKGEITAAGLQSINQCIADGDYSCAFEELDELPSDAQGDDYLRLRASLLVAVGQTEEAGTIIDDLLLVSSDDAIALSLRSVVAVSQNRVGDALRDAMQAVREDPDLAAARIALSYAQQSSLDLESALATLEKADQGNALVLARMAELNLMLGNRGEAVALARQSAALDSRLDRSQIALGFAALALNDHAEAGEAFETAILLNSANPLSHLGLGLSKISAGNLTAGREEIEVAVALDSNNAVLRSYLGKSYFEEKRANLAEDQYDIAKSLDPNDPTAFLYSGILKQTQNQPVEALGDIEASIRLNDNRAVYRSQLLLDQDRAARGTSIARAYNDLGLNRLAVPEASNSLLIDPSNASAHRFLSDSYQSSRRTEIGRVSELFQAQMLQDVNINPLQPSLSATNLNIVTMGGPAQAGFNEFTPLFQKNQTRVDASLQGGNFDTTAGEAAISGIYDSFSYSLGVMSYETEGWRDNNEVEQDLANLFLQYALNEYVNVQLEYFEKDSKEGDLAFNFDPDSFVEIKNTEKEEKVARLGVRIKPSQKSTLLISYIEADNEEIQHESDFLAPAFAIFDDGPPDFNPDPFLTDPFMLLDFIFDDELQIDSEQIEAQYIFDDENFNLIVGVADSKNEIDESGNFSIVSQDGSDIFIFPDTAVLPDPFTANEESEHKRSYLYYNNTSNDYFQFTLGVSRDDYEEDIIKIEETNAKLGIQWMASEAVTVRAAAFETVKPILANNRALEPSQISGFNQFYDDVNGTQSKKAGLAFDVMLTSNFYATLSMTRREMDVPNLFSDGFTVSEVIEEWEETQQSLSFYWIAGNRWSFAFEIIADTFENMEGENALSFDDPLEVDTLSLPISANYFSPTGFFASIKGTHVDQEVERPEFTTRASGEDDFFVVDLSAGYRLPNRRGHISLGILNLSRRGIQLPGRQLPGVFQ